MVSLSDRDIKSKIELRAISLSIRNVILGPYIIQAVGSSSPPVTVSQVDKGQKTPSKKSK